MIIIVENSYAAYFLSLSLSLFETMIYYFHYSWSIESIKKHKWIFFGHFWSMYLILLNKSMNFLKRINKKNTTI